MARIDITPETLSVRFSTSEHVLGLIRDISVPRSAVGEVTVEADALAAVRGLRAPGLGLPGRRKVGTWRGFGGAPRRTAVSVRQGQPAVRIALLGQRWDQVVIGADDATELAARLGAPVGG